MIKVVIARGMLDHQARIIYHLGQEMNKTSVGIQETHFERYIENGQRIVTRYNEELEDREEDLKINYVVTISRLWLSM